MCAGSPEEEVVVERGVVRRGKPWVPWHALCQVCHATLHIYHLYFTTVTLQIVSQDYKFLAKFFKFFTVEERVILAQVRK